MSFVSATKNNFSVKAYIGDKKTLWLSTLRVRIVPKTWLASAYSASRRETCPVII